MKKNLLALFLAFTFLLPSAAFAHRGRDKAQGRNLAPLEAFAPDQMQCDRQRDRAQRDPPHGRDEAHGRRA